ncbi:hypothetical protein LXL04_004598 [Taraxacum kok-saghyz]
MKDPKEQHLTNRAKTGKPQQQQGKRNKTTSRTSNTSTPGKEARPRGSPNKRAKREHKNKEKTGHHSQTPINHPHPVKSKAKKRTRKNKGSFVFRICCLEAESHEVFSFYMKDTSLTTNSRELKHIDYEPSGLFKQNRHQRLNDSKLDHTAFGIGVAI